MEGAKVKYVSEIVLDPSSRDSGVVNNILDTTSWTEEDRPLFRVSKIYPGDKDKRIWFQGPSSTSAWIQILKLLNEKRAEVGMNRGGKYSKRRRSNVAVIHVKVVFIGSFLFYCLLLNHSF